METPFIYTSGQALQVTTEMTQQFKEDGYILIRCDNIMGFDAMYY